MQEFQIQLMVEQCYYQSVQNGEVKKLRFIKNQEAKGLLSNLGTRTPLSKVPILADILFLYKMNEIVNNFLLAGDKIMSEKHLKQP